jgi:hypothetical protein
VRALRFEEPAAQAAFEHLLGAYFVRDSQLSAIDRQIEELALLHPLAEPVARLRAFRGIDTLTAVTIATETCDSAGSPQFQRTWRLPDSHPRSTPAGRAPDTAESLRPATGM